MKTLLAAVVIVVVVLAMSVKGQKSSQWYLHKCDDDVCVTKFLNERPWSADSAKVTYRQSAAGGLHLGGQFHIWYR